MEKLPKVSIIIPCRNEINYIVDCLSSVLSNNYPHDLMEIFVVDGMSNDGTYEAVQSFAYLYNNIYVLLNQKKVKPPGLNKALRKTSGGIICIMDSHAVYANDYIRTAVEKLAEGQADNVGFERVFANKSNIKVLQNPNKNTPCAFNVGIKEATGELVLILGSHSVYPENYVFNCVVWSKVSGADNVGGWIKTIERGKGIWAQSLALVRADKFGVGSSKFRQEPAKPEYVESVFGGCYKREVFDRIGLFNEHLVGSQDLELNLRLAKSGGKILLVPEIKSIYYARSNYLEFIKHAFKDGKWAILPLLYANTFLGMRRLFPMFLLLSLPVSCFAYGPFTVIRSIQIAIKRHNYKYFFTMPICFLTFHFAYGFGNLWGILKIIKEKIKNDNKKDYN